MFLGVAAAPTLNPELQMPLVHFTRKQADVPADAQNVRLSTDWRNSITTDVALDVPAGEHPGDLYLYETHVGLCLEDREQNGYNDSDFIMTVWNPETQAPERITFASTRGWSYPSYGSRVDATPEVRAAYEAYQARLATERQARLAAEEAKTPRVGKTVRVLSGRKLAKGTVAEVRWERAGRLGLLPQGSTGREYTFVNANQVEVVA
jgi:hypothetical protein